jgi:hypothetical protein
MRDGNSDCTDGYVCFACHRGVKLRKIMTLRVLNDIAVGMSGVAHGWAKGCIAISVSGMGVGINGNSLKEWVYWY